MCQMHDIRKHLRDEFMVDRAIMEWDLHINTITHTAMSEETQDGEIDNIRAMLTVMSQSTTPKSPKMSFVTRFDHQMSDKIHTISVVDII